MSNLKDIIGRQITDIRLDEDERSLTIEFGDGSGITIKARGQDAWLEWEYMLGKLLGHPIYSTGVIE